MSFGSRIKNRREELGLSQQELAKRMGYRSRSSINKIELGKNTVSLSKLARLAEALETTVEYLLADENFDTKNSVFSISGKEKNIVLAYRSKPDLQQSVDVLLGVTKDGHKNGKNTSKNSEFNDDSEYRAAFGGIYEENDDKTYHT